MTMTMNDNEKSFIASYHKSTYIYNKSMVTHFTATAKGAEALAYGPQQEYIYKYKINSTLIRAAYRYRYLDIDTDTDTTFRYRYQFNPYRDIHITILSRVGLFCTEKWRTS